MNSTKPNTIRINVWNAGSVVGTFDRILLSSCEYLTKHGENFVPSELGESITKFLVAIAHSTNMYYPESGQAIRPKMNIGQANFLFDSGVTQSTASDNFPCLYIQGLPYDFLGQFEDQDVRVEHSRDVIVVRIVGTFYRYADGFADLEIGTDTTVPNRTLTQELIT